MITAIRPYSASNTNVKLQIQNNAKKQSKFASDSYSFSFGHSSKELSFFDKIFMKLGENKQVNKIIAWANKEKTVVKANGEKVVKKNSEKLAQYMMVAFSAFLQSNHIFNIMRNKEMPQDRKEVLAVNNGLTFVIPTVGAFTIDNIIHNKINKFEKYLKKINGPKLSQKALDGVKAAKTILVFTMMYKYASTLIAMPMANGVTNCLRREGVFGPKAKLKQLENDLEKNQKPKVAKK